MSSVNKVIIVGRLGNDPEVRQFQNGGGVTHISVATSERWNDKNTGERKEQTEWHRISLFNRLGEIAAQYLRKGSMVYVEGSLHTRKYTDQQGIERYATEIRANEMRMLGGGSNDNGYGGGDSYGGGYQQGGNGWQNQNRQGNGNNGYAGGNGGYNGRFNNADQDMPYNNQNAQNFQQPQRPQNAQSNRANGGYTPPQSSMNSYQEDDMNAQAMPDFNQNSAQNKKNGFGEPSSNMGYDPVAAKQNPAGPKDDDMPF